MSNDSRRLVNECISAHNSYRVLHKSPPLTLSLELCTTAYNMAMVLSVKGELIYDNDCPYGQNLYKQKGLIQHGKIPVQSWYMQEKAYTYNHPGLLMRARNFTQVVWASSTELGVAFYTNNDMSFVVALYNPGGNIDGEFSKNVNPASKSAFMMFAWSRELFWNIFYYMGFYDLRYSFFYCQVNL